MADVQQNPKRFFRVYKTVETVPGGRAVHSCGEEGIIQRKELLKLCPAEDEAVVDAAAAQLLVSGIFEDAPCSVLFVGRFIGKQRLTARPPTIPTLWLIERLNMRARAAEA